LQPNLCVFKSKPVSLPFSVRLLERHVSTQMFVPMTDSAASFLVVVCLEDPQGYPDLTTLKVFKGSRLQGFNYRKGVWHHPMIALESEITFACLVWEGSSLDTEEWFLDNPILIHNDVIKDFDFTYFPDLASNANGGLVLFATDDFFAVAENMIEVNDPVWDEQRYTEQGKWMDGWETRRKRTLGHDWCILQLGLPGSVKGFDIDTAFFTGNNAPAISIQGAYLETCSLKRRSEVGTRATEAEINQAEKLESHKWVTILDKTELRPGYPLTRHNVVGAASYTKVSHLRINMYCTLKKISRWWCC
jgi:ureidoglycolate hydrolase